tara:strand:- start:575 stop:793 length:219 start_codon:yes stop_codon:yes gene_type:complete
MKIILILFVCSYVSGSCLPGYNWPDKFDDMYDCLNAGYTEALRKSNEIGRPDVNEYEIFVRFACIQETETET